MLRRECLLKHQSIHLIFWFLCVTKLTPSIHVILNTHTVSIFPTKFSLHSLIRLMYAPRWIFYFVILRLTTHSTYFVFRLQFDFVALEKTEKNGSWQSLLTQSKSHFSIKFIAAIDRTFLAFGMFEIFEDFFHTNDNIIYSLIIWILKRLAGTEHEFVIIIQSFTRFADHAVQNLSKRWFWNKIHLLETSFQRLKDVIVGRGENRQTVSIFAVVYDKTNNTFLCCWFLLY